MDICLLDQSSLLPGCSLSSAFVGPSVLRLMYTYQTGTITLDSACLCLIIRQALSIDVLTLSLTSCKCF